MRNTHSLTPARPSRPTTLLCEADVSIGLEPLVQEELRARLGNRIAQVSSAPGVVGFTCLDSPHLLLSLKTVQAVYSVQTFDVTRPKALLGDEHFRRLLGQIEAARSLAPAGAYKSLYISAAGSESSVMARLKRELAQRTSLSAADEEGDLQIRIRPAPQQGWQTLVRLSPRPLATRAWRVCNFEGALNAAVAHAMVRLLRPKPGDRFLNLACGSGTLLVERLSCGKAAWVAGIDVDAQALACASANVAAAGALHDALLLHADARALPLPEACVDTLAADLPFGHLVGSHAENLIAYPLILREAARVARPAARFVLITHEVRLMEQLLAQPASPWRAEQVLRVELGGLFPRVFVLRKAGEGVR
jgi:23S rRNA G2445 N2-methylase RlmL